MPIRKKKIPDENGEYVGSPRNMGKNDLWIAALAFALNIPLLTTDGDFDFLNGPLIEVIKIA